ncbi:MAG TPA: hypothetical protein VMG12_12105 [Polyangiaceae bacterium]|nr:hypothetical protein [Polyangiaceae bacterium]
MTSLHPLAHPLTTIDRSPGRRGRRRPVAVAALGALAIVGCGEERRPPLLGTGRAIPGCEQFSYRSCDILTSDCQRELFGLAACLHGDSDPGAAPPVQQLDEASAIQLIDEASDGMGMAAGVDAMTDMADMAFDEGDFLAEVRGLELIGLLDAGLIGSPDDVVEATVSDLLAYYLVPTKEVVIIDRGDPVDDADANGVLVHEFVHALQDRKHDLASFGADFAFDSDGYLARSSLIEGEASMYYYLLLFAYEGRNVQSLDFRSFFASVREFAVELTLEAGSPALTAGSIFPYTFGTTYAGQQWVVGGSAAIDALYATPPHTSWEVLGGNASTALTPLPEPPAPIDGYSMVTDDAAGAWVSVAMLASLPGADAFADELQELASRWRGDRYWIYDSPDAGIATLWSIEWASADAAERFAELAAALGPEGAALRIDTSGTSTRITAVEREEDLEAWRARHAEAVPSSP